MQLRSCAFAVAVACAINGCSSSTTGSPAGTPPASGTTPTEPVDSGASGEAPQDTATPDKCARAPSKSGCKNESSWIRGVAKFDPSRVKAGSKPVLRVVLRHGFTLFKGEENIGGRLHAWASLPVEDPSKGELPFAVDMCGLGTAMWSEENGAFHLVLILDEDGNNNLDDATTNEDAIAIGTPGPNELAKMVDVDVSCHAPSSCLEVQLDCTGPSCTAITPMASCKKKTPGCKSDSVFCN